MSRVRVHNFSISLDGFGTGEGLSLEAQSGHAGQRLHTWMFATRFWDGAAGTAGADDAFAERHGHGIGAEIMGAGKFGPPGWQDDPEWRGWWGPNPPFHTPTYVLTHRPRPPLELDGDDVPFRRRRAGGSAGARARGGRRARRSHRRGPDDAARVPRSGARGPPACRAGPHPARPRCPALGHPGGPGGAVRRRGGIDAERRHPSHVHPMRLGRASPIRDACRCGLGRGGSRARRVRRDDHDRSVYVGSMPALRSCSSGGARPSTWTPGEQRTTRCRSRETASRRRPGPRDWFTGDVYIDAIAAPAGTSTFACRRCPLHAGRPDRVAHAPARPDDLRHRGRRPLPARGRPDRGHPPRRPRLLRARREPLAWRGADRFMAHIAMQQNDESGSPVTWGEHVTDARQVRDRSAQQ